MGALIAAVDRLPGWVRAAVILPLPVGAFLTAAFRSPATITLFLVWSAVALVVHLPVFRFDGPLPFSEVGVHARGEVHVWEEVVAVEPLGERDLQARLADGRTIALRVRGRRTRDDLRAALVRHRPQAVAF